MKQKASELAWAKTLDELCATLGFEAATYYLYLPAKRQLAPRYAIGPNASDLKGTPVDIRTGLCGWAARHRQPLLVSDAYSDKRFLREVDSVTGFRTRNCLCLPLLNGKRLAGVIQLLNKRGRLTRHDLAAAEAACRDTLLKVCTDKENK